MNGWRTALRIARREARRSKGRSILVVLMIWIPVLALSFAAVSYDMFELTPAERVDRELGQAQATMSLVSSSPVVQSFEGDNYYSPEGPGTPGKELDPDTLTKLLPPGSRTTRITPGWVDLKTAAGTGGMEARGIDLADPMVAGIATVLSGRAPASVNEVALTEEAVARIGAGIGGTVTLADGSRSYTVVGLVEFPSSLYELVVFRPEGMPGQESGWIGKLLVASPNPITWDDVTRLNQSGVLVVSRSVLLDPPPAELDPMYQGALALGIQLEELSIGMIVAGLGLLEVVLLAGPAFAVGVRRRQRQLALVAANGGTPAHIRRIVLADGVVLGVLGAVSGIIIGILAAFASRPLLEEYLYNARAGGYRVFPLALLAIAGLAVLIGLAAALVPAFVASRQNVVQALSGRRGATRSRKRWLVLGVVLTASGAAMAAYGASTIDSRLILAGLVVGEFGLVLCTPSLVGLIARLGRILPLAPRIALRDTARNRAAAAPAISAVMAAVAGSVAIGVYMASSEAQQWSGYQASLPEGYASVSVYSRQGPAQSLTSTEKAQIEQAFRESIPVAETHWLDTVSCTQADIDKARSTPDESLGSGSGPKLDSCYLSLTVALPASRECPYGNLQRQLTKEEIAAAIADDRCSYNRYGPQSNLGHQTVVDDGSTLATLTGAGGSDLAAAQAMLRSGGAVVTDPRYIEDGKIKLRVEKVTQRGSIAGGTQDVTVPAYLLPTPLVSDRAVISPEVVRRLDAAHLTNILVASTTRMPTQAEEDALRAATAKVVGDAYAEVERGPREQDNPEILLVALVAALITLGATGIATGLAAADGRADLSTLAAVGASPRLRRRLSLSQSGVIAGLGGILGALAGVGAAVAILLGLNQVYSQTWPGPSPYPITLPWLNLLLSLLVVPAVAMLGAGLLTRSRLPIERRSG